MIRRGARSYFRCVGADATDELTSGSCLVVAPHPDDETFGCGGTIAMARAAGRDVTVVIVSDGGASPHDPPLPPPAVADVRRAEASAALARLGVEEGWVVHLGFEDGHLADDEARLATALERVVQDRRPERVLTTSVHDRHPDHAAVGRAARSLQTSGRLPGRLYEYAIWQRVPPVSATIGIARSALRRGEPRPSFATVRPRYVRTEPQVEVKRQAVVCYGSQLPFLPVGFVEDFTQPFEVFLPVL